MYFSDVYGLPIAVFNFYKIRDQIRPTCAWLFLNSHLVLPLIFRVPNIVTIYLLYCIGTIHTHYPCTRPCYLFPTLLWALCKQQHIPQTPIGITVWGSSRMHDTMHRREEYYPPPPLPPLPLWCKKETQINVLMYLLFTWRGTQWFWCGHIHFKGHWKGWLRYGWLYRYPAASIGV